MKPQVSSFFRLWYVWLFPLFAVAISIWLLKGFFSQQGPEIRIVFEDVSSIQAEKTRVRYRGVTIGVVKELELSKDLKDVTAHVRLQKDKEAFTVAGTRYWVVSPKVGLQGITGLETIFDGTYIAVQPGRSGNDYQEEFRGKLEPDTIDSLENTSTYSLETENMESLNPGDGVSYRGLKVGFISKVELAKSGRTGSIIINVENKYVHLIRTNTVFARKVGVHAKLGLFNSEIKVNSMDSIMNGGIEIFNPNEAGAISKANANFVLVQEIPKDARDWSPNLE